MQFAALHTSDQAAVTALFRAAFTASEGEAEGNLVGDLASTLSSVIDDQDVLCFGAREHGFLIAAIFFTRLRFHRDVRVYMLAPVAVATAHQGAGVGQALIRHGLDALRHRSVAVVVTYGDPAFYAKVGFQPLAQSVLRAPFELSMPIGWLGQSLTVDPIPAIDGRPTCVEAFNDPAYW